MSEKKNEMDYYYRFKKKGYTDLDLFFYFTIPLKIYTFLIFGTPKLTFILFNYSHHQLPPSTNFLPPGKSESDPRLPG